MAKAQARGASPWVTRGLAVVAGVLPAIAQPPFGFLPGLLGYALLLILIDRVGPSPRVALHRSQPSGPPPFTGEGDPEEVEGAAPLPGGACPRADLWSTPGAGTPPASQGEIGSWRWKGERAILKSAFGRGWFAGCGYFLVSLWWLTEPFQVDAAHQGWMAPFAVALVSAGMALFWGAAALAYRLLARRGVVRVLIFAAAFAAFEWLRGHILTGFPWDLPGETWRAGSPMSQAAAVVGAYGLTWITLLVSAAPAVIGEGWRGRASVAAAVVAVAGLYAFGAVRLNGAPTVDARAPMIRVVQADVRQESKYDPALFASIVARYVSLTKRAAPRVPDIVVWPEGAIPDALEDYLVPGTWTETEIAGALQPGQTLILGGYRIANARSMPPVIYNSLVALRRQGSGFSRLGIYDKFRLVPFGEFIPFDALAGALGVKTFVHVGDGFTPGPRPRPMALAGVPPVQPLICYEALYPGFTREGANAAGFRPAWIVNISNDAWFGATSGPLQHLNIASYRAIEEGLPMVRATPTGVSAVIDAFGRPLATLPERGFGIIDRALPPALEPTPFSRFGGLPFAAMMIVSLAGAAWSWRRA